MKLRCSPYNPLIFCVFLGIFIVCDYDFANAQCKGEFTFQSFSSEKNSASGKIEVSLNNPEPGSYTFTVYRIAGAITRIQTKEASSPEKITFEQLEPSTYVIKIEWGGSCNKNIGGLEGIIITEKEQGK
jgi:hypothetical protein